MSDLNVSNNIDGTYTISIGDSSVTTDTKSVKNLVMILGDLVGLKVPSNYTRQLLVGEVRDIINTDQVAVISYGNNKEAVVYKDSSDNDKDIVVTTGGSEKISITYESLPYTLALYTVRKWGAYISDIVKIYPEDYSQLDKFIEESSKFSDITLIEGWDK